MWFEANFEQQLLSSLLFSLSSGLSLTKLCHQVLAQQPGHGSAGVQRPAAPAPGSEARAVTVTVTGSRSSVSARKAALSVWEAASSARDAACRAREAVSSAREAARIL